MLNIPVKNPVVIQLITVAAGITAVLVSHFVPAYSVLLSQILNVIGITGIGAGVVQITQGAPPAGDAKPVGVKDPEPTRLPFEPPNYRLLPALLVLLLACSSAKPPCDESKLRAADAAYVARVGAVCLPKYSSKEACPEWPGLKAAHAKELKEICP